MQLRSKLESSKGDTFSGTVISDFLYGEENGGDLKSSMDEINQFNTLKGWSNEQWVSLIRRFVRLKGIDWSNLTFSSTRYYIDSPSVIIKGKPSAALVQKLEESEKTRVAAQVAKLGPKGLEEATKVLDEAKKEHDTPIPTDILTSFPVPDVKSISWIPVLTVQEPGVGRALKLVGNPIAGKLKSHIESDGSPLNFFVQYVSVRNPLWVSGNSHHRAGPR